MVKSVAVIGAGPSGVIALDALVQEQHFDRIRVFERRSEAGGCWIYDESPPEPLPKNLKSLATRTADKPLDQEIPNWDELPKYAPKSKRQRFIDTATYSYLESNVHYQTMEFPHEPFPQGGSELSVSKYGPNTPFRHNTKIKKWVQNIYQSKKLDDLLEFDTSVELVEKNKSTNQWDILLRKFGKTQDYLWKESFDAVVVASGRYDVPYIPYVEGLDQFYQTPGKTVIHTKAYRTREEFRNKKTIVVAGSISSQDTVQDIVNVVKGQVISSVRSTSVPHVYFGWYAFDHPNVRKQKNLVKIENDTAIFEDGSKEEDIDAIIFGTGYTVSYPFLPHLERTEHRVKHIYQHVLNIEDPTLTFVGNIAAGLTFKAFLWQAVLSARYLAGRVKLPSKKDQYEWEEQRLKERGDTPKYSALVPDFKQYFETVRLLAGNEGPGRKLPPFDEEWENAFWSGHQRRINYWVRNNYKVGSKL
ncbi:dimethylaniline monooxygenase [Wickerhamomyces ciferrii]|uniref:Dimethylaniline monooxygenase n=1 Tax=Wickerhamomyces ciferrii (strain ATCC 14091 / BCRC 22168 / CBS 111 / JCM 3599 / NBRC 0793 / NRRL Y-1031 F-60-10) TaxID=1206466 RepID=K0KGN1_WICCF|nr:dimethylaniline monooxygenase [Wickerhamomyces ciferrii]CCH44310.1 dimethylaniline monooxygenase [Wickerhamomyces ciferrii]